MNETSSGALTIFSMAFRSGMGRVVSELVSAGIAHGDRITLIAPRLEHEPVAATRLTFPRPPLNSNKWIRAVGRTAAELKGSYLVWKSLKRGGRLLMIDLYPTIPLSMLPIFLAKLKGARIALNLHDFYPHAFRYPAPFRPLEKWLYRFCYRNVDFIAAMKPAQVERLVNEAGVAADRIVTIAHGPLPLDGAIEPPADGQPLSLLVLGSLRRNKCIYETIAAIKLLAGRGVDVRLHIAGAPRPEEADYWARCLQEARGVEYIQITASFIEEPDLPRILSGMDAILCPYQDFDSQSGISILAITNAVPLIATRSAVTEELVKAPELWTEVETPVSADTIAAAVVRFAEEGRNEKRARAEEAQGVLAGADKWGESMRAISRGFSGVGNSDA
jgi:glycogen synthase